jgi:hypothetical protein
MCERPDLQIVLDPVGVPADVPLSPGAGTRVEGSLQGKVVGIIDNRMTGMRSLARPLDAVLRDTYQVRDVKYWMIPHSIAVDPDVLKGIPTEVDVAVIGLGNCGACTTWECRLSAALRATIPTLDVVTEPFEPVARTAFRGHGLPSQPLAVLPPHAESADAAELQAFAVSIARACASELTADGAGRCS